MTREQIYEEEAKRMEASPLARRAAEEAMCGCGGLAECPCQAHGEEDTAALEAMSPSEREEAREEAEELEARVRDRVRWLDAEAG